jgi:hypothetical protein
MAAPRRHASSRRQLVTGVMLLLLCRRAVAVEYMVGDKDFGWDSGINYAAWARQHSFAVGDVLGTVGHRQSFPLPLI